MIAALASAVATAQPVEVVSGGDLDAWRHIGEQSLNAEQQLEAWQGFIHSYPTSPLAEVAWQRLDSADALEGSWARDPAIQAIVTDLERSYAAHQHALQRAPEAIPVAQLQADGTREITVPSRFGGALVAGAAFDPAKHAASLGARAEYGPLGLGGRALIGEQLRGEASLRATATLWGPWLEGSVDTHGQLSTRLGGRLRVSQAVWLEGSAGVAVHEGNLTPTARVELARRMMAPATVVTR